MRAELARRLAEQAVSQAAAVSEADLAAFAVGRGLGATENRPGRAAPGARPAALAPQPPGGASLNLAQSRAATLHRPDMLTGQALAERLGVSRATVALRRVAGRLLALESGTKRGFRYPAWQADIVADSHRSELFGVVLDALRPRGAWAVYEFVTNASAALAGRTPLEALADGDVQAIRRALGHFIGPPGSA